MSVAWIELELTERTVWVTDEGQLAQFVAGESLAAVVVPAIIPYVVGRRVFYVGCGGGRIAAGQVADLPVSVVGVDPSASQINRLAGRPSGWLR